MPSEHFTAAVARAFAAAGVSADNQAIADFAADLEGREYFAFSAKHGSPTLIEMDAEAILAAVRLAHTKATPREDAPLKSQTQTVAERFEMSPEEWKRLPPERKLALAAEAERKSNGGDDLSTAAIRQRVADGKGSLQDKLALARIDSPSPTKEERRSPAWRLAQERQCTIRTLEVTLQGHRNLSVQGSVPQVKRDFHAAEAQRIAGIIEQKRAAGEQ